MFDIENLIWTILGATGLLVYNKIVNLKYHQAEGWRYLLAVVFFATSYHFFPLISPYILPLLSLQIDMSKELSSLIRMIVSVVVSALLGYLLARIRNKMPDNPKSSTFHDCCFFWKNKFVFITLTNGKVYLAQLLDYTRDLDIEAAIRVEPFTSGYRTKKGQVRWTFFYPVKDIALYRKTENTKDPGLIIPYKQIVTFSLWDSSQKFMDAPKVGKPESE